MESGGLRCGRFGSFGRMHEGDQPHPAGNPILRSNAWCRGSDRIGSNSGTDRSHHRKLLCLWNSCSSKLNAHRHRASLRCGSARSSCRSWLAGAEWNLMIGRALSAVICSRSSSPETLFWEITPAPFNGLRIIFSRFPEADFGPAPTGVRPARHTVLRPDLPLADNARARFFGEDACYGPEHPLHSCDRAPAGDHRLSTGPLLHHALKIYPPPFFLISAHVTRRMATKVRESLLHAHPTWMRVEALASCAAISLNCGRADDAC